MVNSETFDFSVVHAKLSISENSEALPSLTIHHSPLTFDLPPSTIHLSPFISFSVFLA
jgi:hypothetical protein